MNKIIMVFLLMISLNGFSQNWLTDFETAKNQAIEHSKPILLVFQGSDWCAPCIKLDKKIWSTEVFKNYAAEHLILVQADFPRRKKNALPKEQEEHNAMLAEKYNRTGIFPFVAVLDADGSVIGETGYKNISPEAYIEELSSFIKTK